MLNYEESNDPTERLSFHSDGTATIIRYSPMTGKFNKAIMRLSEERYNLWKNRRMLIQDALPHLSNEEREFLITGYTPEDWAQMFPPEDEE
jgi:hypothetical protein